MTEVVSDTTAYRVHLTPWRNSEGGVRWTAYVYRPGDNESSATCGPFITRGAAEAAAEEWVDADKGGPLPEDVWLSK